MAAASLRDEIVLLIAASLSASAFNAFEAKVLIEKPSVVDKLTSNMSRSLSHSSLMLSSSSDLTGIFVFVIVLSGVINFGC